MALLRLTWALALASTPTLSATPPSTSLSPSPAAAALAGTGAGAGSTPSVHSPASLGSPAAATAAGTGSEVQQAVRSGLSDASLKAASNLLLTILQSTKFQVTRCHRGKGHVHCWDSWQAALRCFSFAYE